MFVNMNVLKRLAKAAFKSNCLMIGNIGDSLVVSTGSVVVQVMDGYATNSFKSLIVEYLGWLPKIGEVYSIGGDEGNQLTVGWDGILDIYRRYRYDMPQLHWTQVRIDHFWIFQDDEYNKYAVPEELYKIYDTGEMDGDKEGFPQPPRLTPDKGSILCRNDGMALQMKALENLNHKAFHEMARINLREEDEQVIFDTLEGIEMEFEDKVDGYAKVDKQMKSDIEGMKAERDRLEERKKCNGKNN